MNQDMARDVDEVDLAELVRKVSGRLIHVPASPAALVNRPNPYVVSEDPAAFHTTGWLGAFASCHSTRVVAAEGPEDIAAAVDFGRAHGVKLAIKGTGHDYLGRSSAPGSLLIWTQRMREITVHDGFTPDGAPTGTPGIPAITLGAGTNWLEAYRALSGQRRYVQGGGCLSVGAAGGFTLGGGFGGFSRRYGTAAGNMLEAEVVVASGEILTVNEWQHPDLFWALRGGGGGTFGVVSKLTMRTYPMPPTIGIAKGVIRAADDASFRCLLGELVRFLPAICDERWGEHISLGPDNTVTFDLIAASVTSQEAQSVWRPLLTWVQGHPGAFTVDASLDTYPFSAWWDAGVWDRLAPEVIRHDTRPGAPAGRFWWAANEDEVAHYVHTIQSRWVPRRLFEEETAALADALFRASRHWPVRLDVNKALSGAAPDAVARDRATALNPAVFDAAVLVLVLSAQPRAFPGVPGGEPDQVLGAAHARQGSQAMEAIRELVPGSGTYLNEADYFQSDWQQSFWGENYQRLLEVKQKYDPANIFSVHHGVGSEGSEKITSGK